MNVSNNYINILLLGETGIGKSTFVNALANYLQYETLDVALVGQPVCLIPTQFTVTDDNNETQIVRYGQSDNEYHNSSGQSMTQHCVTYCFKYGHHVIRLIDTPGVGDTRGMDQDRLNFDDMLEFIAHYDLLHLICILLLPNQPRLTESFQYCLRQLLCHLERDASKNIVFLFTKASVTNYKLGDTKIPLDAILSTIRREPPHVDIPLNKQTMYFFDNQCFQYLVALKMGHQYDDYDRNTHTVSWNRSVTECQRLLHYICGGDGQHQALAPHRIQNTLSINEIRRLILALCEPAVIVTNIVECNLRELKDIKDEIKNYQGTIDELNDELKKVIFRLVLYSLIYIVLFIGVGSNAHKSPPKFA